MGVVMLIQFDCSNFGSIKEKVSFSMLSSSENQDDKNLISFGKKKYLRMAEIYGANASGKTTLVNALVVMSILVSEGYKSFNPVQELPWNPHKMSPKENPTTFEVLFEEEGIKFSYGFSYTDEKIIDEYLYYWPGAKKAKIFERKKSFSFADSFKKQGENCKGRLKDNKLLLSCAADETNIELIRQAYSFFARELKFYFEPNNWKLYSAKKMMSDNNLKRRFLSFMKAVGSDVQDLKISIDRIQNSLPQKAFEEKSKNLPIRYEERANVKFIYKHFSIDLEDESSGVQKLFSILCPIADILENNRVLICDEIEQNLHPAIVAKIVEIFGHKSDSHAQLIFTTHNTDLLVVNDLDIRRDQIWFTELKPESRSTDLYSLADINDVRKDENFKRGYLAGRYGAIPVMNEEFFKRFCK